MNICLKCNRTFGIGASVCAYDRTPLVPIERRSTSESARPPQPGDVLGTYRILDEIARGSMGTIFRAQHLRIGREVALKMLNPELLKNKQMVLRFFQEARAVNEIGHPNIVDIIDFVDSREHNPPRVYMVMELLIGVDLGSHLKTVGALNIDEAVDIGVQIAKTLDAVHQIKILHRNLRPENIFLIGPRERCGTDEDGPTSVWEGSADTRIKLLDFGLVRYFGERDWEKASEPRICVGTPEHMAPEQIIGQDLDERTDIYALGLLLYEMLAGRKPFQSENPADLLMKQVQEDPAPISSCRPGASIPPSLEAVVLRCLEKDPARRFTKMPELQLALQQATGISDRHSMQEEGVRLPSRDLLAPLAELSCKGDPGPGEATASGVLVIGPQRAPRPFVTAQARAVSRPMIVRSSFRRRMKKLIALSVGLLTGAALMIGWCLLLDQRAVRPVSEEDLQPGPASFGKDWHESSDLATVSLFYFPSTGGSAVTCSGDVEDIDASITKPRPAITRGKGRSHHRGKVRARTRRRRQRLTQQRLSRGRRVDRHLRSDRRGE